MNVRFIILGIVVLSSCLPSEPGFHVGKMAVHDAPTADFETGKEPTAQFIDAFGLKTGIHDFDKESMKLHGKFFDDRIAFYTVEDPGIRIHDTEVQSLTLYFIDSALMRKKYAMKEDISSELIQSFGNFKFTPHHEVEKDALKMKHVIEKKNGRVVINEQLANYHCI